MKVQRLSVWVRTRKKSANQMNLEMEMAVAMATVMVMAAVVNWRCSGVLSWR